MVVIPAPSVASATVALFPQPIETLVIDRQPLFVAALGSLLAGPPIFARVTSASRSDVGLEMVRKGSVELVFCDVRAEPFTGPEVVRVLAEEQAGLPVVLLWDQDDEQQLTSALVSSAAGLFTKNVGLDEFLVGVGAVLSGHRAIAAGLMDRMLLRLAQQQASEPRGPASQLSVTEREILTMIGRAESVPSIAASRGISSKTVRNHLAKIYRKLELHGRTEAMLWAARAGLTRS
jgi:DNA-binding NarL/FixJ family response regulator